MKKRLIDIYPPASKSALPPKEDSAVSGVQENSGGKEVRTSRATIFAFFVLLLFTVPPILSHVFFAKAHIQVWPQITKLQIEGNITAQIGYDSLNVEKQIIRAKIFEEERELMQLFPATGTKMKNEKARGAIRIHNTSSAQPQALVANTRFISEDGKLFRSEKAISVPASGFADAQVIAAESGEEYNIGPSNFSLPGLVGSPLYTIMYGESSLKMVGGSQNEVAVVTQDDIDSAKDQLIETLKSQATQSLLSEIPPQFQILEDSIVTTVLQDNSLVKPGAELGEFNYTVRVKVAISGFQREDADELARRFVMDYLKENQAIDESTLAFSYKVGDLMGGSPAGGGVIPILAQIKVNQYEKIDKDAFETLALGKTAGEFRQIAQANPFLARIQFSLWPLWISRVPKDSKKVDIDVILNSW